MNSALSTEMMLLILLSALTLIAYMIAINSHGAARMSLSYLLATILLAVTIFAVLQTVNSKVAEQQEAMYNQKIEKAREDGEKEAVESQKAQTKASASAEKQSLTPLISRALTLSAQLKGVKLQGYGMTYDQLTAKAAANKAAVNREKKKFDSAKGKISIHKSASALMARGYEKLNKAATYHGMYYTAESTEQEAQRERILKTSATEAEALFLQAREALSK